MPLIGPPGTELIFACARSSGRPKAKDIEGLSPDERPLPEISPTAVLHLEKDKVDLEGTRGPGPPRAHPESLLDRAEELRRKLSGSFEFVSGVGFPHR